ncbi:DUF1707 SHOCT-like domain-containing protein [Nocardia seriolae]|uniref:DUF1707 domain-containing protein n=1 Tax=Nocardia seriolae TaxID=37332 RepID=A0A0B8N8G3_9NOCA|nr:DUF1707 domain-containing protein [Nocardia seriolae]APA99884.1 hypothetical protein NS506_05848 [Nocardia seriolae]MTJ64577.1 DUF1707 domain-containing protein [Nocardia seriolae]MTJ73357.1 DUF1707 domain-containing protein [Nocardia seriolae]MTJ89420.1 DUF1707 domain-containing protein [Nocardia seriolae]MTK33396.1 DUF1707 domain-containing protein [Nocardia seriolae]
MSEFDPAVYGPPEIRVGTAEREQAAAALGEHFAAGRLDVAEYDDRVGRAYAAKTAGELTVLFGDLPRPQPPAPQLLAPAPMPRRPVPVVPVAAAVFLVFALGFTVLTHLPFFLLPFLFFLAASRGRRGFGPRGPRYYRT